MNRRRQCKGCPWKVGSDPHAIPCGYSEEKHAALSKTIAEPGRLDTRAELKIMACHESPRGAEIPCVGWLVHQLGAGNNIALRLAVIFGRIDADVVTVGRQHATLEDTLP